MRTITLLALLTLVGCSGPAAPAIPPTAGDFVKVEDGVGSARAFGIDFFAPVNEDGATTEAAIDANLTDPQQSSASKRFTLGDDIAIELQSIDATKVQFRFNGQDFGTLDVGDKVVIDDERNVDVNGTPRSPKSAAK